MSTQDEIMRLLKELKEKNPEISACMVAKKGLEGLMMFPKSFKEDVADVWEPLSKNINDMLVLVEKYGNMGLKKSYTEILGYGCLFYILENSDTALIAVMKGENTLEDSANISADMGKYCKSICELVSI